MHQIRSSETIIRMKRISLSFICGSLLLLSPDLFAKLRYRSGTDIMSEKSQAVELQSHFFTKSSSFDQAGVELVSNEGSNYSINDWVLKYSRGYFKDFEGTFITKYRSINSESALVNATNSGLESIGLEGKYKFLEDKKLTHVLGLHFKKAMFTNTLYELPNTPPSDQVALGDDGNELGVDYYLTYKDKYSSYDFKFGYNKPSANLSSELVYNLESSFRLKNLFFVAGLGGIKSLNNDAYSESPDTKPAISLGESRLFNSINREKNLLYAGIHYAFGNLIVGLKGETIYSGSYTDKGSTFSINLRWEENVAPPKIVRNLENFKATQKYFAQGFVGKISRSGNMVKINIGSNSQIIKGTRIDIFSINDYVNGKPIGIGTVIDVGADWSIVKLTNRSNQSVIQVGSIAKAF